MKIIPLFKDDNALIQKAKLSDKVAQFTLYEKYAPKMLSVCKRYVGDVQYAEDVMIQGFLKVFTRLNSFQGRGSFEGWVQRIMAHECINFLKKTKRLVYKDNLQEYQGPGRPSVAIENDAEYLLLLIDELPEASRLVFMLHAVEGYKHIEIAKLLNISENTSKKKLFRARKVLRNKLKTQKKIDGTL